jgi:hypothetical protein
VGFPGPTCFNSRKAREPQRDGVRKKGIRKVSVGHVSGTKDRKKKKPKKQKKPNRTANRKLCRAVEVNS